MKTTGILILSAIFTLFFKLVLGKMFLVFLIPALWIYSVFVVAAIADIILEEEPTTFADLMECPPVFIFGPLLGLIFLFTESEAILKYVKKKFQHIKIQSPILIKRKK